MFFISMSLVIFCLLVCFVNLVPLKGDFESFSEAIGYEISQSPLKFRLGKNGHFINLSSKDETLWKQDFIVEFGEYPRIIAFWQENKSVSVCVSSCVL